MLYLLLQEYQQNHIYLVSKSLHTEDLQTFQNNLLQATCVGDRENLKVVFRQHTNYIRT